jgi:hypothetical protein
MGLASWAILSRPCGTDRDTSGNGLFSAAAVQISRSRKAHLHKTVSVYTHAELLQDPEFLLMVIGEIPIAIIK